MVEFPKDSERSRTSRSSPSRPPAWERDGRADADRRGDQEEAAELNPLFQDIKTRVHRQLLERLNLSNLSDRNRDEAMSETRAIVRSLLAAENTPLNLEERERLVDQILDEVFGLGPLEPLLRDPTISDILVNTYDQVYIERDGKLVVTDVTLPGRPPPAADHRPDRVRRGPAHRRLLPDGGRPPARRLARERHHPAAGVDGPHLSIRKFQARRAVRGGPPADRHR